MLSISGVPDVPSFSIRVIFAIGKPPFELLTIARPLQHVYFVNGKPLEGRLGWQHANKRKK